jgi:hypothetical protein
MSNDSPAMPESRFAVTTGLFWGALQDVSPSARVVVPMVQLVIDNFAAEGVAVYAEDVRRAGLIAVRALQNSLDEAFLEFAHGFVEQNASLHHLTD